MLRLNLGAGNEKIEGFTSVDKYDKEADVQADIVDLNYDDNSVDQIVMYQVLEHLPWHHTQPVLTNCYRMMKPGATITIEVPDLEYAFLDILQNGLTLKWQQHIYGGYHRPWDHERYPDADFHAGSIHYQGFTWERLKDELELAGFKNVVRLPMEEKHPAYKFVENLAVMAEK